MSTTHFAILKHHMLMQYSWEGQNSLNQDIIYIYIFFFQVLKFMNQLFAIRFYSLKKILYGLRHHFSILNVFNKPTFTCSERI